MVIAHACKITGMSKPLSRRASSIEQAKLESLITHLEKQWRIIFISKTYAISLMLTNKLSGSCCKSRLPKLGRWQSS